MAVVSGNVSKGELAPSAGDAGHFGRQAWAASLGNALEWFDLTVYGYLAVTLSHQFFPAQDATQGVLPFFLGFAVSYLARPLGAVVLGAYADRAGRKAAMSLSILLMLSGTAVMVVVPTYSSIGPMASVIVLCSRLVQGFSVGGEFGSATAFLVEQNARRRGFFAAWQWAGQGFSTVLASAFGVYLTSALTPAQLDAWGWRLPFAFGLLIGPVGWYIRRSVAENREFETAAHRQSPLRDLPG